jgi:hypothetical protein
MIYYDSGNSGGLQYATPCWKCPVCGQRSIQGPEGVKCRLWCKDGVKMADNKKIILVDFDGVLHSYTSGWKGATEIPDPPVDGAINFLQELIKYEFNVCIYSSRSRQEGGIEAMEKWLDKNGLGPQWLYHISFPTQKPAAFLTIDDRAICFDGNFPDMESINNFKPWNKK